MTMEEITGPSNRRCMAREDSVTSQTSGRGKAAAGMSRAEVAASGTLPSTGLVRKPLPVRLGNSAAGDVGRPPGGPCLFRHKCP
jgi:hypothetical protein